MTGRAPSGGDLHFEPFVHLAGLDDDQALVAWGGFWFRPFADGRGTRIVDDEELPAIAHGRRDSIGARSEPYGHAVVEAFDVDGDVVARAETSDVNHAWLRGLQADTEYRYRVTVDGRDWVDADLMSWQRLDDERGALRPAGRRYDLRFRTFPDRESLAPLTFCALGDYGTGIQAGGKIGTSQLDLAHGLEEAVRRRGVRLVVTLGDNIYHAKKAAVGGTGDEDDDWYLSYYEPYRWLIAQVPVYPAVGNHDSAESEVSDDRAQLSDNHFLDLRFRPAVEEGRASLDLGLFYRVEYSRLVSFLCIDTSEAGDLERDRFFADEEHLQFVQDALDGAGGPEGERWCIPFGHHPPFCAGPAHKNDPALVDLLVPRFERSGIRLVLSGHEHNFQYSVHNGVHYVVSGAGGKLRPGRPDGFEQAHTRAWAAVGHFLLVEIDGDGCTVWPVTGVDDDGTPRLIEAQRPDGSPFELPIAIER